MPRYPLIISDELYTKLVAIARAKNLSMGKLINQVLSEFAEQAIKEVLGDELSE